MLTTLMGIGCALIASLQTGTTMTTPEGDTAFWVDNWVEAEVTEVISHDGIYEPYYEVVITDDEGWTYTIDDMDADYIESNDWITEGQPILIWVDDGCIEDIKRPDEYH